MKFETIITALISGAIPSIIGYFVTKTKTKAAMDALLATQQHEIDKLIKDYELKEMQSSSAITNEMAAKFISGELDLGKTMDQFDKLVQLQDRVKKEKI